MQSVHLIEGNGLRFVFTIKQGQLIFKALLFKLLDAFGKGYFPFLKRQISFDEPSHFRFDARNQLMGHMLVHNAQIHPIPDGMKHANPFACAKILDRNQ